MASPLSASSCSHAVELCSRPPALSSALRCFRARAYRRHTRRKSGSTWNRPQSSKRRRFSPPPVTRAWLPGSKVTTASAAQSSPRWADVGAIQAAFPHGARMAQAGLAGCGRPLLPTRRRPPGPGRPGGSGHRARGPGSCAHRPSGAGLRAVVLPAPLSPVSRLSPGPGASETASNRRRPAMSSA